MSIYKDSETKLVYLQDTYLFELEAKVLEVFTYEDYQVIVLDKTIFYPQGGGQPSDSGFISNNQSKFEVSKCIFNTDQKVWHLGRFVEGNKFEQDATVKLKIDSEKRILNAKNHTSGHLIDLAVKSLNWNIKPIKGYHFPQGPYVEYTGELEISDQKIQELETTVNQILEKNPTISFDIKDTKHETGKDNRIMNIEGFESCPCGGTHIKNTLEISKIQIKKIKNKKGNFKISYLVL